MPIRSLPPELEQDGLVEEEQAEPPEPLFPELHSPVRTLKDFSLEEIADLERRYGMPVRPRPPKEPT